MNIWTEEKDENKEDVSTVHDINTILQIAPSTPKISTYQYIIEGGLANAIFAHRAWKGHKTDKLLHIAVKNQLLTPFKEAIEEGLHTEGYPGKVIITKHDLQKLHRGNSRDHFLECLKKIKEIIQAEMKIDIIEVHGHPQNLFIVYLSLA